MNAWVHLLNPKTPHNVGGALRACSVYGAHTLTWTGQRVADAPMGAATTIAARKWRPPREERMKAYRDVDWGVEEGGLDRAITAGFTPVCVEIVDEAESLVDFVHPAAAVYVFGPEDGSVPKGVRTVCHRFVMMPTKTCLNLAAAVNVVLYDRMAKAIRDGDLAPRWARMQSMGSRR